MSSAKSLQNNSLDAILPRCILDSDGPGASHLVEDLGNGVFFVASSPVMRKLRREIADVAKVDLPVLLLGASGTGKEVMAQLIHNLSPRAGGPFLKVNCAALPSELLESELFGYEQGAFTGAKTAKPGKFENCNKGTILLDEIGEMTPVLQAKLLHVLQDQQFSRLGGRSVLKTDVRVLAATNIDIEEAIEHKTFREDLYYRLNTFTVSLPPLRDRKEEIPILMAHFVERASLRYGLQPMVLTPSLIEAFVGYDWPGNLRELANCIKRYLVLRNEAALVNDLSKASQRNGLSTGHPLRTEIDSCPNQLAKRASNLKSLGQSAKQEAEVEAILQTLELTNWHRKRAAGILNISYKALLNKIRDYNLERAA